MNRRTLEIGDIAPDFKLFSTESRLVHLYRELEQHTVVLTFYLKAFTPVCSAQVCGFRDRASTLSQQGVAVFGLSSDSMKLSQSFAARENLPYPLLIDPRGQARRSYRIPKLFGLIPGRATFVINQNRRILHISNSAFNGRAHIENALNALSQSKSQVSRESS